MLKTLTEAPGVRCGTRWTFCLLLIALITASQAFPALPADADGPPAIPAIFYGTVTISGSAAPVGAIIQAQINSVACGSYTVTTAGIYGNMLVTGGNSGDTVQFYVNGVAAQTALYNSGERNAANLSTGGGGGGSAPSAPVLSSPASGATGVSTTPTLQWTASSGATSYAVQVSTSSSFASITFSQSGLSGTSVAVSPALAAGTLYYWRANATNSNGTSSWTSAWGFTTAAVAAPTAPTLLSPSNGATGVATSPLLQWGPSTGATSYTVQVSTSSAFSSFVFTQSGSATATTITPALSSSITYYWRANATGSGGTSSWSSTWSFSTNGGSTPSVPAFFKGVAYKNGAAVNLKQVCAVINSGSTCATSDASGNFLILVSGNTGDTVTFTVDGTTATETATFSPGWMTNLNLYASTGIAAVTTGSGSYTDATNATLNGTLTALGSNTSAICYIDYGLTTAYGNSAGGSTLTTTGAFSGTASGLTAGQTYHIRARAVCNSTGTVYGLDGTYVHSASPSLAVTTGSGSYTDATNATLSGTLTALGSNTSAICYIDYGLTTAYGNSAGGSTLTSTGAFSGTASGLTAGQTYHIRARAVGNSTGTVYGSDVTYVHSSGGGSLAVTTGSGSYLAATTATLTSTLTGKGTDTSATCYIDYGLTTAYGSTAGGSTLTSTGAFSGTASDLIVGQTYHIRGRAVGSPSGTTAYGLDATYTHSAPSAECIGSTAGDTYAKAGKYWFTLGKFQASCSLISMINLTSTGTGNAKVAIYNGDSSYNVGSLIYGGTTMTPIYAGTNHLDIPDTTLIPGNYYWLGWCCDTSAITGLTSRSSSIYAYKIADASFMFPTTPTGLVSGTSLSALISGSP